ncbi:eukaryotic peptide chain release factor subunit 1-like protein [Apiospora arundinis]
MAPISSPSPYPPSLDKQSGRGDNVSANMGETMQRGERPYSPQTGMGETETREEATTAANCRPSQPHTHQQHGDNNGHGQHQDINPFDQILIAGTQGSTSNSPLPEPPLHHKIRVPSFLSTFISDDLDGLCETDRIIVGPSREGQGNSMVVINHTAASATTSHLKQQHQHGSSATQDLTEDQHAVEVSDAESAPESLSPKRKRDGTSDDNGDAGRAGCPPWPSGGRETGEDASAS